MRNSLTTRQMELLAEHHSNGVVEVRKLPEGTRIVLETSGEVYELEVGTPKYGVVLIASDARFLHRDKAVVSGSIDPESCIFLPEIIGYGLRVIMRRPYAPIIRTEPVIGIRIIGKNDSYVYRLW